MILRQNSPKMTKKVCKLFFRQPLKNFLLVKWPCSRYLKGVLITFLCVRKKNQKINMNWKKYREILTPPLIQDLGGGWGLKCIEDSIWRGVWTEKREYAVFELSSWSYYTITLPFIDCEIQKERHWYLENFLK